MDDYRCKTCGWQGDVKELDFDVVETCMGSDEIEMCPKCGSLDVAKVKK